MDHKLKQTALIKILLIICLSLLIQPYFVGRIENFLARPNGVIFVGIYLFIYTIYLISLIIIAFLPNKLKVPLVVLVVISNGFILTYNYSFGRPPSFFDYLILINEVGKASDAISFYLPAILKSIMVQLPLIAVMFLYPSIRLRRICVLPMILIYCVSSFAVAGIVYKQKTGHGAQGMPAASTLFGYFLAEKFDQYSSRVESNHEPRSLDGFSTLSTNVNNIVLIIDESIRWDHIDINGSENVTPFLAKNMQIINLGKAISYANSSQYSNLLLRGLGRSELEPEDARLNISVWTAMKNAGYQNILLDAQEDGLGHNFFTQKEFDEGDVEVIPAAFLQDDIELAESLNNVLAKNGKKFIYIIKKGAHFPYKDSNIEQVFKPTMNGKGIRATAEEISNSYKNAIRHNVDGFFNKLEIRDDTLYIYTSDHGQNLSDLDKYPTHGNTVDPFGNEFLVPLFMFGNMNFLQQSNMLPKINKSAFPSHYHLPFLLLEASGYNEEAIHLIMGDVPNVHWGIYGNVMGFFGGVPDKKVINGEENPQSSPF